MGNAKGTTKRLGQKDDLDRFYTRPEVADALIEWLVGTGRIGNGTLVIEPSAGAGSFVLACERRGIDCLAFDLEPSDEPVCETEIVRQDFLTLDDETLRELSPGYTKAGTVFIGNPPFGVQGGLAVAFINHAMELADMVCFILPPSFKKQSIMARMPHARPDETHPLTSTTYDTPQGAIDVPSEMMCFSYVDEKPREASLADLLSSLPFEFCGRADAQFSIRRVGGTAGRATRDTSLSTQSNYMCRVRSGAGIDADGIVANVNALDFPERDYTVGPRSISKRELAQRYIDIYLGNGDTDPDID